MFKKITNITIALILLISFTGFTIDLHYCKDKLYDVGLISEAMECCESEAINSHADDCEMNKPEHSCCDSENHDPRSCERKTVKIESPSDYYITPLSNNFKFEPVTLLLSEYIPVINDDSDREDNNIITDYFLQISPPETGELLSFLQSYLN